MTRQGWYTERGFLSALRCVEVEAGDALLARCQWLTQLDAQLRATLPAKVAEHCALSNVRDGVLVFVVDAGAWHSALRMHAPALLRTAQAMGVSCNEVLLKVGHAHAVASELDHAPAVAPTVLSDAARAALQAAAVTVTDAELQAAMRELARGS